MRGIWTMEAFFPELLDRFSSEDFLRKVCAKYHYEEMRLGEMQAVAAEMMPLMRREAFWETCFPWIWESEEKKGVCYEGVLMTLGKGLDCLQESYHSKGMLTESYMLEVLAGELLLQAYQEYNCHVDKAGNWHVARYHFPGSEEGMPLKMLPEMLSRFSGSVSCNEAFCILPKKSVVFLAELTQDEKVRCEGICAGCKSINCPNKMEENIQIGRMLPDIALTYGYRAIFGI